MRTRLGFLLLVVAAGLLPRPAAADYYWGEAETRGTYVLRLSLWLSPGLHTFETRNLTSTGDTVMHLSQGRIDNEVARNDDCPGAADLSSCITYTVTRGGFY